jgi:hypothetical protein
MRGVSIFVALMILIGMAGAAQIDPAKQIDWSKTITADITVIGNVNSDTSTATLTNETAINATLANLALGQTAQNGSISNLGAANAAQNSTLSNIALGQTYQNTTLTNLGLGQAAQNATAANVALGQTAQNNSISALAGYVQHMTTITGGLAGNFTLTGAAAGDAVAGVAYFDNSTGNLAGITDLSAEFNIPDTNILNQTYGGTSSLNGYLLVSWTDKTA